MAGDTAYLAGRRAVQRVPPMPPLPVYSPRAKSFWDAALPRGDLSHSGSECWDHSPRVGACIPAEGDEYQTRFKRSPRIPITDSMRLMMPSESTGTILGIHQYPEFACR